MFQGCKCMNNINLSNWKTYNLNDTSCMFADCTSLTHIYLDNFITKNIKSMNDMFDDCNELVYIYIPNIYLNKCMCSDMFKDCKNIYLSYAEEPSIIEIYGLMHAMIVNDEEHIKYSKYDLNVCRT